MDLSIQDWGAIGELFGGVAVVATLIYLSVQLKQTSAAIKISTAETGTTHNAAVWREIIANPGLTRIILKGNEDVESLDEEEYTRYMLAINMQLRFFEHQFLLNQQGALPDGFWIGMHSSLRDTIIPIGAKYAWSKQSHLFTPGFREYVDGIEVDSSNYVLSKPVQPS
jgi:hypothetical protein